MKVRELLQFEIWSKQTTQGIFLGFGIVALSLLVTLGLWYEVDLHWLTKGERDAARLALQRVDELQAVVALDDEYKARDDKANAALKAAEDVAKTDKDDSIHMNLSVCLTGVETAHTEILEQRLILEGRLHPMANGSDRSGLFLIEVGKKSCSALHKELD
jgi:hypothetical protein